MDLQRLHAAVPAAEEEDLLDEVRQERERVEVERLLGVEGPAVEPAPPQEEGSEPPFSERQVLGMLEHHLGARVVDGD